MSVASRMTVSVLPGVLVTFGLLVLMYTLIATSNQEVSEVKNRKIADIFQPKREVTENVKEVKPEKPEDAEVPPPEMPTPTEQIDVPKGAIDISGPMLTASLDIGLGGGFNRDSDYIPVYVPQPQYPRRAQSRGVSGYAVVQVTITTSGSVRDPVLLEEYPENYGFGNAALKAALKLKYNPRVVDGKAEEVPGVMYKFSFQIEK